jgi:hypothetical protein
MQIEQQWVSSISAILLSRYLSRSALDCLSLPARMRPSNRHNNVKGINILKLHLKIRIFTQRCCLPMAELVYSTLFTTLSGAPNTQSVRQTPKYYFLVGHEFCIHNIPQYRLSLVEYRQPKLPSSYQLNHLVIRHLSQVLKNPPCSGFEPGTSQTKVRRSKA